VNYYDPSGKFACNPDFCGSDDEDDGEEPNENSDQVPAQRTTAPQPPVSPDCDRTKGDNATELNWIAIHGADALTAANKIGTTEAIILGLSALESGWGTGAFVVQGRNNYFSQHAPAPGSNGSVTQNGNTMATYSSYLASALGFDASASGQLIANINSASQAASILQNAGKYGINKNGSKVPTFVTDVTNTVKGIAVRLLDCFH
jgi:hypothetical protein